MDDLQSACRRYENLLSRTIADSDVGRINAAGGETVTVDPKPRIFSPAPWRSAA